MAIKQQGKAPKVKDRWYGAHRHRRERDLKPREFSGEPQFRLEDIYISPFTHRRETGENGRTVYVELERNLHPTGIRVVDDLLRYLSSGGADMPAFCKRYGGARVGDIDSLTFLLTGMRGVDFRQAYHLRLADDLLRYTSLPMTDIARLSGFGSRVNLYFAYKRDLNTSPTERRNALRQSGDVDLYRVGVE